MVGVSVRVLYISVAKLKERHIAAKATVNGLRERLKQRRQALLDTNGRILVFLFLAFVPLFLFPLRTMILFFFFLCFFSCWVC